MIKSMTAFGRGTRESDGCNYTAEIRSINKRYKEIVVRLPQQLLSLEDRVKKLVSEMFTRGRIEVVVSVRKTSSASYQVEINLGLAKAYWDGLCQLKSLLGIELGAGVDTLMKLNGVLSVSEADIDLDKIWEILGACIEDGLAGNNSMRDREGRAIYDDFQKRLKIIEEYVDQVESLAPEVAANHHKRLMDRLVDITRGKVELDQSRLAQEAAYLAEKSDVTEEIVRCRSHFVQFRSMMDADTASGRALDFLLQELNREINTIGSKSEDARLSHLIVAAKSELEKIREQAQNVE